MTRSGFYVAVIVLLGYFGVSSAWSVRSAGAPDEALPGLILAVLYLVAAAGLWLSRIWSQYLVYFLAGFDVLFTGYFAVMLALTPGPSGDLKAKVMLWFVAVTIPVAVGVCIVVRRHFTNAKQI